MDEPTSALDRATQRSIVKLLRDLQESEGLSYLFISHDLKVIRALCHRVIVLKEGKILEQQDTDALFKHPQHSYTQRLISASEYRID